MNWNTNKAIKKNKKELFDDFFNFLKLAGKDMNDKKYFRLEIAGSVNSKQFELNYCFELYHKIRSKMDENYPLTINGEVDKRGHEIISNLVGDVRPDFIVHKPKSMNQNLVVMEVKPFKNGTIDDLDEDVNKLKKFIYKAKYFRGIMLVFSNENIDDPPDNIKEKMKFLKGRIRSKLLFVWHGGVGFEPKILNFKN